MSEGTAAAAHPAEQAESGSVMKRLRRRAKQYVIRRRRSRAMKKRGPRKTSTYVLLLTLIGLLGSFAYSLEYLTPKPTGDEITVDQFNALAQEERLDTARFLDEDAVVMGTFVEPPPEPAKPEPKKAKNKTDAAKGDGQGGAGATTEGKNNKNDKKAANKKEEEPSVAPPGAGDYYVSYPTSDAFTAILVGTAANSGASVTVDPQPAKSAVRVVSTFLLPLMILANLFALLFTAGRGSSSGIGEVQMFGTIAKGKVGKGIKSYSFADVAGADEAVDELKEVRDYLRDPEKYEEIGATPPKGVLLVGPPGCGKTLLAKAVAGEAGVPFFSVAGAEFVESLVGVGAARVRDLFARVRAVSPAIVFIDELDAAGRKRGAGGGGNEEREQTLNQILVEMDGFDVSQGMVVMGATNRPDILDPALLRPGRFDRYVTVEQPDSDGRKLILQLHAKNKPMADEVDYDYLARRTPGFSGADLANVINEAALLTVREGSAIVGTPLLEEAIQRVVSGTQKKGRVLTDEERQRAAYHEAGHAVVSAATGHGEEVHRVSILARGKSIGAASVRRESDAVLFTKTELFVQLVTSMGGLAAEEMVFGEHSTGAEEDLLRATENARDMVGRFGMGSKRRRLLSPNADEYLSGDSQLGDISDQTHQEMEEEIDRLLKEAEHEAGRLLDAHRDVLDELAGRLSREETLEGLALQAVLDQLAPDALPAAGNGLSSHSGAGTHVSPANKKRRE
ncbi:MAG: cell division protease FtsH [Actinomycetota bacterium]|jgi:cell division protease FtsH|nr:cell division protease FtsH [Actinomycetota bacterium]